MKVDARWDDSTWWEVFGELHTGGIWLKKLNVIAKDARKEPAALKQADPKGNNLLQNSDHYSISLKNGKPADSVIGNYFFLPALGDYGAGRLGGLGSYGSYWSSSAFPSYGGSAYYLYFNRDHVNLSYHYRENGFVAQPFE